MVTRTVPAPQTDQHVIYTVLLHIKKMLNNIGQYQAIINGDEAMYIFATTTNTSCHIVYLIAMVQTIKKGDLETLGDVPVNLPKDIHGLYKYGDTLVIAMTYHNQSDVSNVTDEQLPVENK